METNNTSITKGSRIKLGTFPQNKTSDAGIRLLRDNLYKDSNGEIVEKVENPELTSEIKYYKFSPIEWEVVSEKNSNLMLLSLRMLVYKKFNNTFNSKYEDSQIRKYLNETLYNTCFSEDDKKYILPANINNSISCPKTSNSTSGRVDYMFLPSLEELMSIGAFVVTKRYTEYAQATAPTSGYFNSWITRTRTSNSNLKMIAQSRSWTGEIQIREVGANEVVIGIVPAIWIRKPNEEEAQKFLIK